MFLVEMCWLNEDKDVENSSRGFQEYPPQDFLNYHSRTKNHGVVVLDTKTGKITGKPNGFTFKMVTSEEITKEAANA